MLPNSDNNTSERTTIVLVDFLLEIACFLVTICGMIVTVYLYDMNNCFYVVLVNTVVEVFLFCALLWSRRHFYFETTENIVSEPPQEATTNYQLLEDELSETSSIQRFREFVTSSSSQRAPLDYSLVPETSMKHPASVCSSMTQPAAVCSSMTHPAAVCSSMTHPAAVCSSMTHPAAVCSSMTHPAAVCSSMKQPVAVCSSMTQSSTSSERDSQVPEAKTISQKPLDYSHKSRQRAQPQAAKRMAESATRGRGNQQQTSVPRRFAWHGIVNDSFQIDDDEKLGVRKEQKDAATSNIRMDTSATSQELSTSHTALLQQRMTVERCISVQNPVYQCGTSPIDMFEHVKSNENQNDVNSGNILRRETQIQSNPSAGESNTNADPPRRNTQNIPVNPQQRVLSIHAVEMMSRVDGSAETLLDAMATCHNLSPNEWTTAWNFAQKGYAPETIASILGLRLTDETIDEDTESEEIVV
ncbi:hypothetical protein CDAR_19051 [Caerostris darwini]|uniref:Transmembrane protein n=1 Tax=Caerostris darwini TaxID=1538125 RepID=A0AAV4WF37_9ARAC|nr:hypothetical protein CDAR_19051 [Caerostris darwini]